MKQFNEQAGKLTTTLEENAQDMCCPKGGKYHEFHKEVTGHGYSTLVFPKSGKKGV